MALNYLEALSEYFPGVEAYCDGDPFTFESLVFTKGSVAQGDLEDAMLSGAKLLKIKELSEACGNEIVDGWISSASGTPRKYDAGPDDQLNLVGVVALNSDYYYSCRDPDTLIKEYVLHTADQLKQVLADGAVIKLQLLQKFNTLRAQVTAMTTLAEVTAVTW